MTLLRRLPFGLLLCGLIARAQDVAPQQTLSHLMQEMRYEEVISRGLALLRDAPPSDRRVLGKIHQLMGTASFVLGDEPHARSSLVRMFTLYPDAQPPETASPKLLAFWERVRIEAAGVALDPAPLREIAEGRPIVITARTAGSTAQVGKVLVHARVEGAGAYASHVLKPSGGHLEARLPPVVLPDGRPRRLEYWFEAQGPNGEEMALVGTEAAPLRATLVPQTRVVNVTPVLPTDSAVEKPVEPAAPPRSRPFMWVAAGSSAALLAAGLVVGLHARSQFEDFKAAPTQALGDRVNTEAMVANVLFATGGAAAVTALVLYFVEGRPAGASNRATLRPMSSGGWGLEMTRRF